MAGKPGANRVVTSQAPTSAPAVAGGALVAGVTVVTALGHAPLTPVDLLVLLGVAVVLPLAFPRGWSWFVATSAALVALLLPVGILACSFAAPWIVVAITTAVSRVQLSRLLPDLPHVARTAAAGYALVGSAAFTASRLGVGLFGTQEPIVELTAVHFTFAGCGALVLATRFIGRGPRRSSATARVATVLIATAPAFVAAGFVSHHALPQVGGAVVLTVGVWLTATLELVAARDRSRPAPDRLLLVVSGLAVWGPMVLAVSWAAGQHWDVPALSIDLMVRTHGVANALAFVVCGLVAAPARVEAPGRPSALDGRPSGADERHERVELGLGADRDDHLADPDLGGWVRVGVERTVLVAHGQDERTRTVPQARVAQRLPGDG